MIGSLGIRGACFIVLMAAVPAFAAVPGNTHSGVLPSKGNCMPNLVSAPSHLSPPQVTPIERSGVRYEQDVVRQSRPDAERGGWLLAKDSASGKQLWSVQLYANPFDAASSVGSPPRWFQRMELTAEGAAIEIEDDTGTHFLVDLTTRAVTERKSPLSSPTPRVEDKRPKFE